MKIYKQSIITLSRYFLGRKVHFEPYKRGRYGRETLRCKLFGHICWVDNVGGVVVECCERCSWTGRSKDLVKESLIEVK